MKDFCNQKLNQNLMRGGEVASRQAHNLEIDGSTPSRAIGFLGNTSHPGKTLAGGPTLEISSPRFKRKAAGGLLLLFWLLMLVVPWSLIALAVYWLMGGLE